MNNTFDYKEFRKHVIDMVRADKLLKKEVRRITKRTWNTERWKNDLEIMVYLQSSISSMQTLEAIAERRLRTVNDGLSAAKEYAEAGFKVSKFLPWFILLKVYWNVIIGTIVGYIK